MGGNGKAGKSQVSATSGKAGKIQNQSQSNGKAGKGQGNAEAGKAGKGQGDAGGWPSTSGNPSGSGRSNAASKSNKAPATLWEQVRLLETKSLQEDESLHRLEAEKNVLNKEKDALEMKKKNLQKGMATLQKKLDNRPNVPIIFRGHYKFGLDDSADLSRLISMYLENKPNNIDRDQIYDCVCACVDDFYESSSWHYYDSPHYFDMKMLLATCLASNWFSDNQRSNIESLSRRYFQS